MATYQHTQKQKFMYRDTCGNTGAHAVPLSPQIYCTIHHKAPQLVVSALTTLKVIWDQPSDQNTVEYAELILMQHDSTRPHTARQYVVTEWQQYATYCISVCCYSMTALGHILHTSVLLEHGISLRHLRMLLVENLLKKSRMCSSNG